MFCGLVQMYQHFKTACFLHSILLFPSTVKMEATNAGAIQTKYMASHLHHSFQISEQYSEGTITCPTHPLQVACLLLHCLISLHRIVKCVETQYVMQCVCHTLSSHGLFYGVVLLISHTKHHYHTIADNLEVIRKEMVMA
jgi:hypothetical protein